jgi:hypothetical protein
MSSTAPIVYSAAGLDLSPRHAGSTAIVASPTANAETIVASMTLPSGVAVESGVRLIGWVAFTAGTSGVSANVRIRQTSVTGTAIVASGALTVVAADLYAFSVFGFDTAPPSPGVYKLTLTIGSGGATSTVSAVYLAALVI